MEQASPRDSPTMGAEQGYEPGCLIDVVEIDCPWWENDWLIDHPDFPLDDRVPMRLSAAGAQLGRRPPNCPVNEAGLN